MEAATLLHHALQREYFSPIDASGKSTPVSDGVAWVTKLGGGLGSLVLWLLVMFGVILPIVLYILAIYLAYTCNKGHPGLQVIAVLVALFLPLMYLLFYLVYYKLLGHRCGP
jgi:hypothetical protein